MKNTNPGKQRKAFYNAPLHKKRKMMASHLEENLLLKYDKRSIPVVKGDTVKVMRGSFRGHEDKVVDVNIKKNTIYIEGITMIKADGNKIPKPIHPSNVMVTKLNLTDKWRRSKLERDLSEDAKKEIEKEAAEQIKQAEEEKKKIEEELARQEAEKQKEEQEESSEEEKTSKKEIKTETKKPEDKKKKSTETKTTEKKKKTTDTKKKTPAKKTTATKKQGDKTKQKTSTSKKTTKTKTTGKKSVETKKKTPAKKKTPKEEEEEK